MKTKVVDISKFWGSQAQCVIKKLSIGDTADIRSEIKVDIIGSMASAKPDMGKLMLLTLQKGIVSAPFIKEPGKATMEEIRSIDGDLGEFLISEIDKLNEVSPN